MLFYSLGSKTVSLLSTGHDKLNITVILAANADGKKKKPYCIFRGKGAKKSQDNRILRERKDIIVGFSENGWANETLIEDWINKSFSGVSFGKRLLIWDAFRAHVTPGIKKSLKQKRVDTAVIPGGCTAILQAPDVVWNKPFKVTLLPFCGITAILRNYRHIAELPPYRGITAILHRLL